MVIGLERGADLHMAQLMPLPLTVSCFSRIQIGFTFLVLTHPGCPGKKAVKCVCVCVCGMANTVSVLFKQQEQEPPFYDQYTGQLALAGISSLVSTSS